MNPIVTILLTTYNRAHLIGETLDSILAQTYTNWECIIVDDNSSDHTEQFLKEQYLSNDKRFSYYKKDLTQYKKGLGGSRNQSLDIAKQRKAEFIHFFDDDDLMHSEKINYQIQPLLEDENIDFTICEYEHLNKKQIDLKSIRGSKLPLKTEDLLYDFITKNKLKINLNSCGPLWRAKLWKNHRFNEELKTAEEYVAYCQLFIETGGVEYETIPYLLFFYRKHEISNTKNRYKKVDILYSINLSDSLVLESLIANKKLSDKLLTFYLKKYVIITLDYDWYNRIKELKRQGIIRVPIRMSIIIKLFFTLKKIIIKIL